MTDPPSPSLKSAAASAAAPAVDDADSGESAPLLGPEGSAPEAGVAEPPAAAEPNGVLAEANGKVAAPEGDGAEGEAASTNGEAAAADGSSPPPEPLGSPLPGSPHRVVQLLPPLQPHAADAAGYGSEAVREILAFVIHLIAMPPSSGHGELPAHGLELMNVAIQAGGAGAC